MRVLLADDCEVFLKVAQRYLSHHGHDVKIANSGLECVSLLHHYVPDVVVLDRELLWGGSDGVRAFMFQVSKLSLIPLIMTSNDMMPEESGHTASPPVSTQLQKPFRLDALLRSLQVCSSNSLLNPA